MTLHTKRILTSALFTVGVVGVVWAGNVTLPNSFTTGTPARAAEVNANFTAVKAAVDDNFTQITALKTLPAWTDATLLTGWSNVGSQWANAAYLKDPIGFVHFRGLLQKQPATAPNNVFTVPVGYRPSKVLQFPVRCGNDTMCYVHVNPNGNVDFGSAAANDPLTSVTLDGITYDPR